MIRPRIALARVGLGNVFALFLLVTALLFVASPAKPAPVLLDVQASSLQLEERSRAKPRPVVLDLVLEKPVPYRAYVVADPPRLILELQGVGFGGVSPEALPGADQVPAIRWGQWRRGWGRVVVELPGPARLVQAEMRIRTGTTGQPLSGAVLHLRLDPVDEAEFTPRGGDNPDMALRNLPDPAKVPAISSRTGKALRVMLDPGHGGIDPGAVVDGVSEADLMLGLAEDLADLLRGAGAEVLLTREDDSFVGLERRNSAARAAGADVFISLHADALPAGAAAGTAFYVWNPKANDQASRQLVLRHDRDDLLAGLDLGGADDEVASILMELSRIETQPRSEALAGFMVAEVNRSGLPMHRQPRQGANFSVLKAPDIPSVLIETGFLTDEDDRARLLDPVRRQALVTAIARAVLNWAHDDHVRAPLLRQ